MRREPQERTARYQVDVFDRTERNYHSFSAWSLGEPEGGLALPEVDDAAWIPPRSAAQDRVRQVLEGVVRVANRSRHPATAGRTARSARDPLPNGNAPRNRRLIPPRDPARIGVRTHRRRTA